jgi:hypothetical protein
MALQLQTFNDFTPPMWSALAAKLKADTGVEVAAPDKDTGVSQGTLVHGSFTFTYKYVPELQYLELQCQKKPLFIPASTIVNGLNEEVLELMTAVKSGPPAPAPAPPPVPES